MNIFLIGYRCTGKTSAGRALAKSLGRPFFDADAELVEEQVLNISDIVSQQGWDAFREMEKAIIKKCVPLMILWWQRVAVLFSMVRMSRI